MKAVKSASVEVKDIKDKMLLDAAVSFSASYLVTGDKKHLLPLKSVGRTKIISPKEFARLIGIK